MWGSRHLRRSASAWSRPVHVTGCRRVRAETRSGQSSSNREQFGNGAISRTRSIGEGILRTLKGSHALNDLEWVRCCSKRILLASKKCRGKRRENSTRGTHQRHGKTPGSELALPSAFAGPMTWSITPTVRRVTGTPSNAGRPGPHQRTTRVNAARRAQARGIFESPAHIL